MPNFLWTGPGVVEQVGLDRAYPPRLEEPSRPDVPGGPDQTRLFQCDVSGCGRRFKKAMIVARHFNTTHSDLQKDKDSWRKWSSEVWE